MTFAQQSKSRSHLMNTKPDRRTINSTFNFDFNSSFHSLSISIRKDDKKNLLKVCAHCISLLQLHQFLWFASWNKKQNTKLFITNFRWSFNVEVARLPIVCVAAINRHSFFHKMLFMAFELRRVVGELANVFTAPANMPRQWKWGGSLREVKHKNNKDEGRAIGYTLMMIWIMIAGYTHSRRS